MKAGIKALVVAFACFAAGVYDVFADDGVELLKPCQPGQFQMATLGPWTLAQHDGASASLGSADVAGKKGVIVLTVISASKGGECWHLDLSQGGLKLKKGANYKLSFSMKGANLDQITVSVAKNHEPWDPVLGGEPQSMSVGSDWQDCSCVFALGESDENGRLSFSSFNATGATLNLANVSLKELPPSAK